jgi:methionyl-tRNA formyltransferase
MRSVFFGSAEFSVDVLDALPKSHWPNGIVTAIDKQQGRGLQTKANAVAEWAADHHIPHIKVVRSEEALPFLTEPMADVAVVAAWGEILPPSVLKAPKCGCINIHASLLPRYRGATPVQQALLDGAKETGVSIMRMDEGLDTGPIYRHATLQIDSDDTAGSLSKRLALLGAQALVTTQDELPHVTARPQHGEASFTHRITTADAKINWTSSAESIERLIRAMSPTPGAWSTSGEKRMKILKARISDRILNPGELAGSSKVYVGTGTTALALELVQPAGGRLMSGEQLLHGQRGSIGRFD